MAAEQAGQPAAALRIGKPLFTGLVPCLAGPHPWLPRFARLALQLRDEAALDAILATARAEADREPKPRRAARTWRWCQALAEEDPGTLLSIAEHCVHLGLCARRRRRARGRHGPVGTSGRGRRGPNTHGVRALGGYRKLGAVGDHRRMTAALARWGIGGAPEADGVTGRLAPTERKVAELVATGWPNADIATALSLPRTSMHRHVSEVIRKTGAGSRLAVTPALIESLAAQSER